MFRQLAPLIALAILYSGCKKALLEVEDYFPKVRTETVTANPDGSVTVTGVIVSQGASPVDVAGFCSSGSPLPIMTDNQAIAQVSGDHFSVTYSGLAPYTTYYFRSWATNEHGYSYGDPLRIDSVMAVPVTPPFTPEMNTISPGGGLQEDYYYPLQAMEQNPGVYELRAQGGYISMRYYFGTPLQTGVYTTQNSVNPGPGQMKLVFYSGTITAGLNNGSPVYVNQLTPTSWEVTICYAPWSLGSGTAYFTTRFVAHL